MSEAHRIPVEDAQRRTASGDALLVCAYEDEERCRELRLDGALTLHELRRRLPDLSPESELIFYCA